MRQLPVLLGCALLLTLRTWGGSVASISCERTQDDLSVIYCGKPLMVYSFGSGQFKPYVKELRTLAGENVLLDAPADHLHHHGLMYAIRVNGTNFWEEVSGAGKERHVSILQQNGAADERGARISFVELVHWLGPPNFASTNSEKEAVLVEERTITLLVDKAREEVALRWRSSFQVGATSAKLHGSAYNGLGLRLPPDWNGAAQHSNSEDLPYTPEHKWDVTPAKWAALSHQGNQFTNMVALFGHPVNPGQTRFFSMNNPFAYLSVTQNLEEHPIDLPAGARFDLDYLLLIYPVEKSHSFLSRRYEEWLKQEALR